MASAPATAEEASAQQAADGYFSALVPAKYVLVTTFKWGRTPVSTPVRMMVQGDRAYFRAWSRSPAGAAGPGSSRAAMAYSTGRRASASRGPTTCGAAPGCMNGVRRTMPGQNRPG